MANDGQNFTMPDPEHFASQEPDQRTELLYQQALKAHNETVGLRAAMNDITSQLLEQSNERTAHYTMLAEALSLLRDATESAASRGVRTTGSGEVKVNTKQPRVAAPRVFGGDSEQVDQFLADCWLNFHGNNAYADDSTRIAFALSYMKDGSASQWANNVVLAMQTPDATGSYATWESFRLAVIEAFKGGAQIEIAQAKMERLRQNKSTATEYFTVLDSLNKTAGYDTVTLIRLLKRGIDERVIKAVYSSSIMPTKYEEWKSQCIKHDGLLRAFHVMEGSLRDHGKNVVAPKMFQAQQNNAAGTGGQRRPEWKNATNNPVTHFGNNPVVSTTNTTTTTAPAPMDIDRADGKGRTGPSRSVCFSCRQEGHIARNCPRRLAQDSHFRAMYAEVLKEEQDQADFSDGQE